MPTIPANVSPNHAITATDHNAILDCLRAVWPKASGDILPNMGSGGGTSYLLARASRSPAPVVPQPAAVAIPTFYPFQIYQVNTATPPASTDWRTVRVRGAGATINNGHADNDDLQDSPLTVVIPASQTNYKFWLELGISTAGVFTWGTITSRTIKHGDDPTANGWDNYPEQPEGDSTNGAPPDKYFILIADGISTGVDSNPDNPSDPTIKKLVLPLTQTTRTSLLVNLFVSTIGCSANGFVAGCRLTHGVGS